MPRKKIEATTAPADAVRLLSVLATESEPADTITIESDGKAYTVYERQILLHLTCALLGQQPYGTHPDAVVSRHKDALKNAEAILPLYLAVAHKDA